MNTKPSQPRADEAGPTSMAHSQADATRSRESSRKEDGKKKRFFGLLKRKESDKSADESSESYKDAAPAPTSATYSPQYLGSPASAPMNSPPLPMTPTSNPRDPKDGTISPRSPLSASTSPSRIPYRSSSPRLLSPASSLIFERSVQDNHVPDDLSSSVPSHIQTENHIPPVLEASSKAITSDSIDPSEVEIVTHSLHQPAAITVPHSTTGHLDNQQQPISPTLSIHQQPAELADPLGAALEESGYTAAASYGGIDTADVRRLSFISFADVVQGEHAETHPAASGAMSMSSSSILGSNRSPSPLSSPPVGRSPPVPLSPDDVGMSGVVGASPVPSELVREKMSSALRAVEMADLHDSPGR